MSTKWELHLPLMFPLLVEGFHGDTTHLQLLISIFSLPFHTQSLMPTIAFFHIEEGLIIVFKVTISAHQTEDYFNIFNIEVSFRWYQDILYPEQIKQPRIVFGYLWPNRYYQVNKEDIIHADEHPHQILSYTLLFLLFFYFLYIFNPPLCTPTLMQMHVIALALTSSNRSCLFDGHMFYDSHVLLTCALPLICLGCNKDLWSQRSKYKSYGALRGCNLGVRDCLQVYCGK